MKTARSRLSLAAALATTAFCALGTVAHAQTPTLTHTVVMSGLEAPWDMAFLATARCSSPRSADGLSVRMPSGDVMRLLGMTGTEGYSMTADDLFCEGQAGMNGVAVDPDFASNRLVYVYSTSNDVGTATNRVLRHDGVRGLLLGLRPHRHRR
jgi:aldose sugar dehydrogenase